MEALWKQPKPTHWCGGRATAYFWEKGGKCEFAASASHSCREVESRHLREFETAVFSAVPQGGYEP
jgi:hypothetical protein